MSGRWDELLARKNEKAAQLKDVDREKVSDFLFVPNFATFADSASSIA